MNKIKWLVYEQYTGKILATARSFERAEKAARKHKTHCFFKSDNLPEWTGRSWKIGDVLPLRDAQGRPTA